MTNQTRGIALRQTLLLNKQQERGIFHLKNIFHLKEKGMEALEPIFNSFFNIFFISIMQNFLIFVTITEIEKYRKKLNKKVSE